MNIYRMKLDREPFEKIASGQKIIESRLYDEKRQLIKVGDSIEFYQNDDEEKRVITKVKSLHKYKTFSELFSAFPVEYFGGISKKFLIREIKRFYSNEDEKKYGVVGIKIELKK
ncbi:MAG: ASCH domain-containing protein [Candidatus Pacebacteria bacterium]|nr:ASCH domain-containing protein [Candidatus Paceibacterota bacterium]